MWFSCCCITAIIFTFCFSGSAVLGQIPLCHYDIVIDGNITDPARCRCNMERNGECTCKTLQDALLHTPLEFINCQGFGRYVFTYFLPEEPQEVHNTTYPRFYGVQFVSKRNISHISCTGDNVGWNFDGIAVSIQNITFIGCSALHPSTTRNVSDGNTTYDFKVALYFNHNPTIQITGVTVYTSLGVTGVVMYNPSTAIVESSLFIGSGSADRAGSQGGCGIVLELSACSPGSVSENCEPSMIPTDSGTYRFRECTFANNSALSSSHGSSTMDHVMGWEYNSFGKGGGLSIIIRNKTSAKAFAIDNCTFVGNFAQFHGGGLFVSFLDSTQGNSVTVQNSVFWENVCAFSSSIASSGGAIHLEYLMDHYDQSLEGSDILSLAGNIFCENTAFAGGALFLTALMKWDSCRSCGIHNTNFTNNAANFGSAIYINKLVSGQPEFRLVSSSPLVLKDCNFIGNHIYQDPEESAITKSGLGTVYSNQKDVSFESSVLFESNEGSALVMVNAVANFSFSSNTTFSHNTHAKRGGAICLLGSSYLLTGQNTHMVFESNSAGYRGGAIYNQQIEPVIGSDCFVKYDSSVPLSPNSLPASWCFKGNVVEKIPNAIHSTSVLPCISSDNEGAPLCWKGWVYDSIECDDYPSASERHITTDTNSALSFQHSDIDTLAAPGWPIPIGLSLHDDLNNTVVSKDMYLATLNDMPLSVTTLNNVSIEGTPDEQVSLRLESLGDRSVHISLRVNFTECPPGFVQKGVKCTCPERRAPVLKCNDARKTAVLMGTNWIGKVEKGHDYFIAPCPLHLCKVNNFVILPYSSSKLSEKICKANRGGVMCGKCDKGFCLSVNSWSFKCIGYNNSTRIAAQVSKHVSAVYLPYTAFLLIITAFHLKLTKGSLNGLILFAQMITTTFDITQHDALRLKKSARHFPKTYRFLYGAFNLNFMEKFIPDFCISSDFNIVEMLLLNYLLLIVPILAVCIAAGIVKVSRCCTTKRNSETTHRESMDKKWVNVYFVGFSKTLRENVVLLLSTVVLLSYTKLSTTTSQILHVLNLQFVNGSTFKETTRVFIAGQMSTDSDYTTYQILAVLCGIYLSTLVLVFLDYPLRLVEFLVKKIRILRAVYPSTFIGDFVSTFQSYYKPKFKCFSGIYFIFRFVASLVYFSGYSSIDRYVILEVSCVIMVLLVVVCKPYKESSHNLIDIFIFASLAVINALNFHQNSYFQLTTMKSASNFIFGIQYVLSMIPIVCFLFCCCMKLAIRSRTIRQQLQNLLLKVPNDRVKLLNTVIASDAPPHYSELSGNFQEAAEQPSTGQGQGPNVKAGAVPDPESHVPVTIVHVHDKDMGEAVTYQTSVSEGHFLKSEWSFEREDYGTLARPRK